MPLIRSSLSDSDKYKRDYALQAMAKMRPDEARVTAKRWLVSDEDEKILAAAKCLASLGAKDNFVLIEASVDRLKEDYHRRELVTSACALAAEKDVPALIARLRKVSRDVDSADQIVGALTRLTGQHMGFIHEADRGKERRNEVVIGRWEKWLQKRS